MRLSKLDWIDRFSPAETNRILEAAKVNVDVEAYLFRFNNLTPDADGTSIDTQDPRTIYAANALEAARLLDPGRTAADILNAPPASGSLGGFSVGDVVTVKPPFSSAFPGEYRIEGVEAESLVVCGSSFSPDYLEHA